MENIDRFNMSKEIAFFDKKEVHRELIKWVRNIAKDTKFNQFSASIEIISQFIILTSSLMNYLDDENLLAHYTKRCKELYPQNFVHLLRMWDSVVERLEKNTFRVF